MTRLTAKDFPQQLLEYYDYYAHGKISKREFLQLAGKYTVGGMTALALFNLLKPDYALAEQVPFTDPDIRPEYIHYPSPDGHGEVRAYLVTPTKIADKAPAVVVVHENRGLNPYIEDVARRVAKAGYIALAPDRRRGRSVSPVFATAAASATRRRWRSRSWPARCRFTVASRR